MNFFLGKEGRCYMCNFTRRKQERLQRPAKVHHGWIRSPFCQQLQRHPQNCVPSEIVTALEN